MNADETLEQQEKAEALENFAEAMREIRRAQPTEQMIQSTKAALERLLVVAQSDTGQSSRVANFLLAWWNAGECGGFDLTDLWAVDTSIAADMVAVFSLLANWHHYPDKLGFETQFKTLVETWRKPCEET